MTAFSNWTVGKRLVAGFGLSALTLLLISAISYYNIGRLIENDTWVKHTYQVRRGASMLSQMNQRRDRQARLRNHGRRELCSPQQSAIASPHPCSTSCAASPRTIPISSDGWRSWDR